MKVSVLFSQLYPIRTLFLSLFSDDAMTNPTNRVSQY